MITYTNMIHIFFMIYNLTFNILWMTRVFSVLQCSYISNVKESRF